MKMAAARVRRKSAAAPMAMPTMAPVEMEGSGVTGAGEFGVDVELGTVVVGAEVVTPVVALLRVDVSGRSEAFQAIWIMGAYRFMAVTALLGSVVKPKLLLEPPSQEMVGNWVDLARMRHVWPWRLSHLKPSGQQPTNVSSASIWN
jgi:hypothetical protein